MTKPRNRRAQDLTLVNLRALKKQLFTRDRRIAELVRQVRSLSLRVKKMERSR